jgi:dihydrofolate synthase/folylpolyglutamate synthase
MNYTEALEFLDSRVKLGTKLGLEKIRFLLESLNCSHKKLNCIHIAGTNGKGSVASMVSSILIQAGYKVGLYTSPHLVDIRERIKINRKLISTVEFSREVTEIKRVIEENKSFNPTVFEILTALALNYFYINKVDFVLLEVGMGGRLDATNVVNSLISVITNVGLDHVAHLGRNKKKIAREKIEIIKEKNLVVTAEKDKEILNIISARCREKKSKLLVVGKDINCFSLFQDNINYQTASFEGRIQRYEDIKIPLLGDHQVTNTATAIGIIETLLILGIEVSLRAIKQGILKTEWSGRFQIVNNKGTSFILDCAHNTDGFLYLTKTIKNYFPDRKFSFIVTFSKDKEIEKMLKFIVPYAKEFIFPNISNNKRVISKTSLENRCLKITKDIKITKVKDVRKAISHSKRREVVFITGSIFLIGEALKVFGYRS